METFMRHPVTGDQPVRVEAKARKQANDALYDLGLIYHDGLPIQEINWILTRYDDFNPLEDAIYCGRDGQVHEQVGAKTWLTMTWHKMESGRYEIVAYLS
jgi:hypothetical protein